MSSFKLPRAVSWLLTIRRGEAQLSAALAVVFDDWLLPSGRARKHYPKLFALD
jgi:hypothetical protein